MKASDRRKFLKIAAAAAIPAVGCRRAGGGWRFFTHAEAETVNALCEQIIPADQEPGAAWAGVVYFIDRQLTGRYREFQPVYRRGIAEVDRRAREHHGKRFVELAFAQQTEILRAMERDEFFNVVVAHTMQGFYGGPRHGGNRDAVSWKMLGVPAPPVRGRLQIKLL